ncbi:transglutaminase-like domain-containing protein [uncultured Tateyamaria sp.]|uniref:transglutaminase-like domain-containing protein n=1 Tax=Tateyamaria sp. 1078 TaxID=3417464 RepID=UPI00260EE044|nr:transglutaminase-like domain-containing protein [uncultured Tateyamaria sp.]
MPKELADTDHPLVQATASRLTQSAKTDRQKLRRLFLFVRDDIAFGFPTKGDLVPASETIKTRVGQCNTKATLLLALCRASGLRARIHFSLISKDIQRGFFTGIPYWLIPKEISHAWIEVEIDGTWRRIDSFINDTPLHQAAVRALARHGWNVGFSLALNNGQASADLNIDAEAFEQMAAVTDNHGVWDEPADYYASALYKNRPGLLRLLAYRLFIGSVNRRIEALRAS